jgi:hypothetical protein
MCGRRGFIYIPLDFKLFSEYLNGLKSKKTVSNMSAFYFLKVVRKTLKQIHFSVSNDQLA